MDILYGILLRVKKRPGMYLRRVSLKYLYVFINGCLACLDESDQVQGHDFYPGFQEFIQEKYKVEFDKHWSDIIEFYCYREEEAFYLFFDLLDEFIEKSKVN